VSATERTLLKSYDFATEVADPPAARDPRRAETDGGGRRRVTRLRRSKTDQAKGEPPMRIESDGQGYWRANIRLVRISLVIWALASFGFGILLRPMISGVAVGGTDLGFWFAQQGSILVFLALIFFYAWRMNALDREYGVDEE
jgi:putative solute:sodium symporter small subunit